MSKASEEKTKGFVAEKLKNIPTYPSAQNTEVDGVTWFKEDSYKGTSYDWLMLLQLAILPLPYSFKNMSLLQVRI